MRDWRKILSSWWTKMWSHFCIMESGGYQGIPKLLYQAQISFSSKADLFILSLTCGWAKVSAGRKSLSSTSQARSLNFAILKVKTLVKRYIIGCREKRGSVRPLLRGQVCQCDLHNQTLEVEKRFETQCYIWNLSQTVFDKVLLAVDVMLLFLQATNVLHDQLHLTCHFD